uniref:Uncharacterized protein MANES_02G200900 n=1 Tax=Rhizophora mucronata TaxID=61149 RepID=A0A2P2LY58_RHIMU
MGILQCTDERQASPIFGLVSVIQSLLGTFCNARTSTNQPISGLCHCPPKAFQPGSILQCIHKHQPTPFLVASNSSSSVTFRMDAKAAQSMQFMSTTWVNSEKLTLKPSVSLSFAVGSKQQWRLRVTRTNRDGHGSASLAASCSSSSNNFPASTLESKSFSGFLNEDLILKSKSQDIGPCLNGRCVYLVGMMGSGKTTIGKILSQALDHSFFDRLVSVVPDHLVF